MNVEHTSYFGNRPRSDNAWLCSIITLQDPTRHVRLFKAKNMTIDFQGSDLFLAKTQRLGITLTQFTNTVLQNFTIDFLQLPFTQLRVVSVDPSRRQVQFQALPGWSNPSVFNTPQNAIGIEEPIHVFIFRNGKPAPGLTRMEGQRPFTGDRFTLVDDHRPWDTNEVIARIQPGDTAELTARAAGEPINADRCDRLTLRNVKIFSSGIVGLLVTESARSLIERVYVMPKPGTDRLISSNAGGILPGQPGDGNTIRLCRAIRTLDDGFAPHTLVYGTVQQQRGSRTVLIQRQHTIQFPNGVPVVFQSRTDGKILGSAVVVSQNPPPTQAPLFGETVQVDFDRNLPDLPSGAVLYSSDPSERGNNTVLERNTVQDQVFARGITLWGLMNSTLRGNYIRDSPLSAIFGPHRHAFL